MAIFQVRIPETGSIVSTTGGLAAGSSWEEINGRILKVDWIYSNSTNTGSVWLVAPSGLSHPEETLHYIKGFGANATVYPRAKMVDSLNAAISDSYDPFVINDKLFVIGSGLGDTKTIPHVLVTVENDR